MMKTLRKLYIDDYTGSETALSEINKLLRKDTTSAISKNKRSLMI